MENKLRKALAGDEFIIYYQPVMDIRTGHLTGLEALIRLQDPDKGLIAPIELIPFAEENNLIIAIGEWIIKEVCLHYSEWQKSGLKTIPVSVNLSSKQFTQKNIAKNILDCLKTFKVPTHSFELEITEMVFLVPLVQ